MFRLTDNIEIFKSTILGSPLFVMENVFHDHEWIFDYAKDRSSSSRLGVYKDPKAYKEHSTIVSNTQICELQHRLSLLCKQQSIDPGICHINFIKLAETYPKFIERAAHNGYKAILYLNDNTGTGVDLIHKATGYRQRIYAAPNLLVLYDNSLFDTKYVFEDSIYLTEPCVTMLMYFTK